MITRHKNLSSGFTLAEMLISISLGLFLNLLLIKIYLWQEDLHYQMEDMIFLDRQSILAVEILGHAIRGAEHVLISEQGDKIEISNHAITDSYYIQNNELYRSRKIAPQAQIDTISIISGINKFQSIRQQKFITIKLTLTAPHHMTANIHKTFELENEKP